MAYLKVGRRKTDGIWLNNSIDGSGNAIISGNVGTAQGKIDALSAVEAQIAETPWDIPPLVKELL